MSARDERTFVDNEVYDVLKAASAKLEGLAAYNTYEHDGQINDALWRTLRQQDEQAVRQLLQRIAEFAQQGRLQAK